LAPLIDVVHLRRRLAASERHCVLRALERR
jgi:hypothetical protein